MKLLFDQSLSISTKVSHLMSVEIVITLLAGIATALSGNLLYELIRRLFPKKGRQEGIEGRVLRLTKSLDEATSLIDNIEAEIKARSGLVTQLQKDIDQYNQLVALKKPEVEAVAQLLRGELQKENRSSFWKGFAINFLFFLLGAGASWIINIITK